VKVMVVSKIKAMKRAVRKKEYLLLIFKIDYQIIGIDAKYNGYQKLNDYFFLINSLVLGAHDNRL
jgi:hypothetical protein